MGADIHCWIETRADKNAEWTTSTFHKTEEDDEEETDDNGNPIQRLESGNLGRNYGLFSILANVRGNNAIYPERGAPKDMSPLLQREFERWDGDGHSHSWLWPHEFKACLDKYSKSESYSPSKYIEAYEKVNKWLVDETAESQLLGKGLEPQARFVFWFDN